MRVIELEGDAWDRVWVAGVAANPGYADELTRHVPIFGLDPQR